MQTTSSPLIHGAVAAVLALTLAPAANGGTDLAVDQAGTNLQSLVTAALNPVSKLAKVPFQNNFDFGIGPNHVTRYTLDLEPIIPFTLNEDWNLITRTIIPTISQPSAGPVPRMNRAHTTVPSPKGGWVSGGPQGGLGRAVVRSVDLGSARSPGPTGSDGIDGGGDGDHIFPQQRDHAPEGLLNLPLGMRWPGPGGPP